VPGHAWLLYVVAVGQTVGLSGVLRTIR
jgi:hypothetical protein